MRFFSSFSIHDTRHGRFVSYILLASRVFRRCDRLVEYLRLFGSRSFPSTMCRHQTLDLS